MTAVVYNLRWWLLGQIGSMVVIAVLISIALWAIGAPLALALGFLAGAFEIIPNVGPMVWLIPALLIAILGGVQMVFQVFLVYCGLHLFESYVLVPIVQRQVVRLPPAISILAISLLTLTLGILGTMLAAPIAVVTLVIVKMVYIEDRLGDHKIEVPGNPTVRR
jgi:predicted PurR-regulated permease PerM